MAVLAAAALLPSLAVLPAAPAVGAGVAGAAIAPAVASPPAATADPVDVPNPRVRTVDLAGIDDAVLARAPQPHAEDAGRVSTLSAARRLSPAVAARVKVAKPAELVAVASDAPFPPGSVIQVRVRERKRGWSDWFELAAEAGHGPDPGSVEAAGARSGSDPLLARNANRVQVRIDTPDGTVPAGTQLTLVNARKAPTDATLGQGRMSALGTVGMPSIITRSQWGADESWRSREPWYTDNIRAGFVHHTASTSSYSASQAASQIRAIYAYHTKSLGHSDIDYNFVVDRFGRLYEGRYGGMDRPVLGGHTAGFNEHTFAVVALGNFETFSPPASDMAAMKDSIARLFAWKLGLSGVNPGATVKLVSAGYIKATKYPKGSIATISATSSHQTVNYTSCPGRNMQAELASIRALGESYSQVVVSAPSPPIEAFRSGDRSSIDIESYSTKAVTWTADILSPCSDTPVRSFSGTTSGEGPIVATWDLRDSAGTPVLPATYTIRMSGALADGTPVAVVSSTVTITPAPGGAWGPCANASRVAGDSDPATSVIWGRIFAPSATTVVLTAPATQSVAARAAGVAAAPLAHALGAPLLLTPAGSLDGGVAADIRARAATEVIIVGGPGVVSDAVAAQVAGLGVTVTRLAGSDDAGTAAAVAARMGPRPAAVLVSPDGARAHSLTGAALAAALGVPALIASPSGVPDVTRTALAGRTSVTVVAPKETLSDDQLRAGLGAIPWTRLWGADEVAASLAVGSAFPAKARNVMLFPDVATTWATTTAAAAVGGPLLFTAGPTLAPGAVDLLGSRPELRSVTTPVAASSLDDQVLGATSRLLLGLPWSPPGVTTGEPVVADPPVTSPPAPKLTDARKVLRTDASPEPVRRGSKVKAKAKVRARYSDGQWRRAPAGLAYTLKFKKVGGKYRTVITGTTKKGRAVAYVTAKRSGRWRIIVGSMKSRPDYVRVKR